MKFLIIVVGDSVFDKTEVNIWEWNVGGMLPEVKFNTVEESVFLLHRKNATAQ
jgi:hypothetical protein